MTLPATRTHAIGACRPSVPVRRETAAGKMRWCLNSHARSNPLFFGVPVADDPAFPALGYWRGFVWGPMAALVYWSLDEYSHLEIAQQVRLRHMKRAFLRQSAVLYPSPSCLCFSCLLLRPKRRWPSRCRPWSPTSGVTTATSARTLCRGSESQGCVSCAQTCFENLCCSFSSCPSSSCS